MHHYIRIPTAFFLSILTRAVLEEAIDDLEITLTNRKRAYFRDRCFPSYQLIRINVNPFLQNVLRKSMLNYLSIIIIWPNHRNLR